MRVSCDKSYIELDGDHGTTIESIAVSCRRCGAREESFGASKSSVNRSLAVLNERCPRDENNFYEVKS
jgi:hypothetical protein